MSADPFNLNGQAVAAELVRVMAERDEAREFKETYHEQWMLTARAHEAAEQQLADLRAAITAKRDEWTPGTDEWHEYDDLLDAPTPRHDALLVEFFDAALGDNTDGAA